MKLSICYRVYVRGKVSCRKRCTYTEDRIYKREISRGSFAALIATKIEEARIMLVNLSRIWNIISTLWSYRNGTDLRIVWNGFSSIAAKETNGFSVSFYDFFASTIIDFGVKAIFFLEFTSILYGWAEVTEVLPKECSISSKLLVVSKYWGGKLSLWKGTGKNAFKKNWFPQVFRISVYVSLYFPFIDKLQNLQLFEIYRALKEVHYI